MAPATNQTFIYHAECATVTGHGGVTTPGRGSRRTWNATWKAIWMPIGRRGFLAGTAAAALGRAIPASAQDYPTRPITFIIPFPPGGSTTIVVRSVSDKLAEFLGQQIVIDNRAGAGGTVGTRALADSAPGRLHHRARLHRHARRSAPASTRNVGYDPRKDFAAIGRIGTAPNTLVVHPSFPAKTVAELIAYAKANPGKVNYGSAGIGTVSHVCGVYFANRRRHRARARALQGHRSGAARPGRRPHPDGIRADPGHAIRSRKAGQHADAGGDQRCAFDARARRADHRRAGRAGLRRGAALRRGGAGRHAAPDHRKDQQGAQPALASDEVRKRLALEGAEPLPSTPEEYAADIDQEATLWAKVVKALRRQSGLGRMTLRSISTSSDPRSANRGAGDCWFVRARRDAAAVPALAQSDYPNRRSRWWCRCRRAAPTTSWRARSPTSWRRRSASRWWWRTAPPAAAARSQRARSPRGRPTATRCCSATPRRWRPARTCSQRRLRRAQGLCADRLDRHGARAAAGASERALSQRRRTDRRHPRRRRSRSRSARPASARSIICRRCCSPSRPQVNLQYIPYKGSQPLSTDLIGGHVKVGFNPIPVVARRHRGQAIRALAATSIKRSAIYPDLPTIAEVRPARLRRGADLRPGRRQPARRDRSSTSSTRRLRAALATDEVKRRLHQEGAEPMPTTPEQHAAVIDQRGRQMVGARSRPTVSQPQ